MFMRGYNDTPTYQCQYGNVFDLKNTLAYGLAMNFASRLQHEMDLKKLTDYDLSERSGVPQPTINRIRRGLHKNPGLESIEKLAHGLNISASQLLEGFVNEEPADYSAAKSKCFYPRVVGTARCGDAGYYMDLEGGDGYIEFDSAIGSIAIRIKGHSMHPAIREGWFVIIEPDKKPDVGEYVLAKFKNGKKMVKELLQIKNDSYLLLSVNDNERITAYFDELESDIQAISAIVPPSKHKEW